MRNRERIIACLDIKNDRVVKGVNFEGLRDAGDPAVLAQRYMKDGADELVFLDISATTEERETQVEWMREVIENVNIPITVGGGIRGLKGARAVFEAGADKISVNSAAVFHPEFITVLAEEFGKGKIVLAIDTKKVKEEWYVVCNGGKRVTGKKVVEWAKEGENLGAGEILLTSMDCDGMKNGYDIALASAVAEAVAIPVIISGGAGKMEDFNEVFRQTKVTAALGAGVFHSGDIRVDRLKEYLREQDVMEVNFENGNGLVPVVIQDSTSLQVLMLGYMNKEAYTKTKEENRVTFFSRSRNGLWTKGETSGNYLGVEEIFLDCDRDAILIRVCPEGPTCHTGNKSCFATNPDKGFLYELENIIAERIEEGAGNSYTNKLFKKGINKVAQKVGEEAVEVVIEAKDNSESLFKNEVADLLYHLLVLLKVKNLKISDIERVLRNRNKNTIKIK